MVMIDKDWQIALFGLQQARGRLKIEAGTGVKFKQSTLKALQRAGYTKARTREAAIADLDALIAKIENGAMAYDSNTHRWVDVDE